MGQMQNAGAHNEKIMSVAPSQAMVQRASALQPKGTCWYCDRPVDNIKRFCSTLCRHDYFEEEGLAGREKF